MIQFYHALGRTYTESAYFIAQVAAEARRP
jgi:hypothetical protein